MESVDLSYGSIEKALLDKKYGYVLAFEDNQGLVKSEHF